MGKEKKQNEQAIVPSSYRRLAKRSAKLVQRGLKSLLLQQSLVIQFPKNTSLGRLFFRDSSKERDAGLLGWILSSQSLGEAQGKVIVPQGKDIALFIKEDALNELSSLLTLKIDNLKLLAFPNQYISSDNLSFIGALNSVEILWLPLTSVNEITLNHLKKLPSLKWLYVSDINTDTDLANLRHALPNCTVADDSNVISLINKDSPYTAEQMMQKANAAGYRDKNGQPFTNIEDFLLAVELSAAETQTGEDTLEDIWDYIGECTRCPLYQSRSNIVHSEGNPKARLMFVGEAPGLNEDAQGHPFVGHAGQLLNNIIKAMGFKREDVFVGNIVRCRPPQNRAPLPDEVATCKRFLLREIAIVQPEVIITLGNTATKSLLDTKEGISKLRGTFQDFHGIKVMPTYHPAYLLRDTAKKHNTWEDVKKVRDYLRHYAKSNDDE